MIARALSGLAWGMAVTRMFAGGNDAGFTSTSMWRCPDCDVRGSVVAHRGLGCWSCGRRSVMVNGALLEV